MYCLSVGTSELYSSVDQRFCTELVQVLQSLQKTAYSLKAFTLNSNVKHIT